MLNENPLEFSIKEFDWQCKLAYEGNAIGKYLLWINDVLASELPKAPPIEKDHIPTVCQSENLVLMGDTIKRVTFQIFVHGLMHQIVADHNCRSLCTSLEVDDKIIKQWDGLRLDEIAT